MKIVSFRWIVWALLLASCARADVPGAINVDHGWRLWLDPRAEWKNDRLYLPEDVHLKTMPVNPPTGGWSVLNDHAGIPVSLPATVEQFYWNRKPALTAASTSPAATVNAVGYYPGVSWWYRPFTAPPLRPGERLIFHFPGARLRAEVYVNGRLVGYNIISEAPFSADATDALNPGRKNLLAIRITNPGGRIDWMDFLPMKWGRYTIPATHAFGGLAAGVEMEVRAPVSVSDLTVLNRPDPRSVRLEAEVTSTGRSYDGPVDVAIVRNGRVVYRASRHVQVPAGGSVRATIDATVPDARLWGIGRPNLYEARATLPGIEHSGRDTTFGFRWLGVSGLGTDAKLELNGRRIVPLSAISWGYWAPNGMFPDRAAVAREIAAMKAIGLDALQNHRHMPKALEVDAFNRTGFLLYCEAGGGVFTFQGAKSEPPGTSVRVEYAGQPVDLDFLNRYQLDKELAMIRAFRSNPCVSLWTLQNETDPDVDNPRMRYALDKMREADPSRIILLKSGESSAGEVWSLPYRKRWMKDDGSGHSGWWDQHTAMDSPGVWTDRMYDSPKKFEYNSDDRKEVVVWGEMATGASPDDHAAIVRWYQEHHQTGYDEAAHQAILSAYDTFLDHHGFRAAFPTAEKLFREAAAKHYFSAAHVLENARMCNANDYIVLSGWESTTVDDHSGLVDSLRQLKADPARLHHAAQPEVLVIRARHDVVAAGDTAVVDIHQINTGNLSGAWRLEVTAALAGAKPFFQASYPVDLIGGDTFGQLLKPDIRFQVERPGLVTIRAALRRAEGGAPVLGSREPLLVVDPRPEPLTGTIACSDVSGGLIQALRRRLHAEAVPFSPALGKVATILIGTQGGNPEGWQGSDSDAPVANTRDPGLYQQQMWGGAGAIHTWHGLTPGHVRVRIYLDDGYSSGPGQRVFDLAINGTTVAKNLDLFVRAGGKDRALVETYEVEAPKGVVSLTVPRVTAGNATLAAAELRDSSGRVVRAVFRDERYTDPAGHVWTPVSQQDSDYWKPALSAAMERARRDGTRVVLLTSGGTDSERIAAFLASRGLVTYAGPVGGSGPSWMGFWFFGRRHWLLAGLPSNCVLDWPYQITSGNGLMLSGPAVESVIGYGRNHDPNVGVAAAVIPCGRGRIVFLALPGLMASFENPASGQFQPVTAERLVFNALDRSSGRDARRPVAAPSP